VLLRMSNLFLRTLREDPADAEVPSHKLLVRGGFVRRTAPGVYSWLPLGKIVLENVAAVVREEMNRIGAQEVLLPALLPREYYEATGRWTEYGDTLFRLKDRKGADYLLGPTTKNCSPCSSRASTPRTRTTRSSSTRSRRSSATRRGRAPGSCGAGSST